jgi:hypothetical protein
VDKWVRLDRFLVLGSEGGTYYITERKLTQENARVVIECLADQGPGVGGAAVRDWRRGLRVPPAA